LVTWTILAAINWNVFWCFDQRVVTPTPTLGVRLVTRMDSTPAVIQLNRVLTAKNNGSEKCQPYRPDDFNARQAETTVGLSVQVECS
jgi:hypothetical protein